MTAPTGGAPGRPPPPTLAVGDVVALRSGGVDMVVTRLLDDGHRAVCCWQVPRAAGADAREATYDAVVLRRKRADLSGVANGLCDLMMWGEIRRAKEAGTTLATTEEMTFLTAALARCHLNHAQMAQDLWVLYELADKRGGYFVEFGAGDGVLMSNTCLLEREFGWHGVLAEPNPAFHAALRRNRQVHVSTRCIVGDAATREVIFNQTDDPHLAAVDTYSASDMHADARRHGRRTVVEAQTLAALLAEVDAPRNIDYLSLDTEGSELDILQGFDFEAYSVGLVTVEHNFTANEARIDAIMAERGFRRRFASLSGFDAWYRNERLVTSA